MQLTEAQLFERMGRLGVENDLLRGQLSFLSNAIVSFLETDKKIKDKWVKLHGEINKPETPNEGKK